MENEYRIPLIEEFKQGFKFELLIVKKGQSIGGFTTLLDEPPFRKNYYAENDIWEERVVFWDKEPETITTIKDGVSITYTEDPLMDWHPWINKDYIINLIKNGRIRTRK